MSINYAVTKEHAHESSLHLITYQQRAWSSQDYQALYKASKKAVASCPTIVGPTTLEFPRPGQMSQIGMESKRPKLEVAWQRPRSRLRYKVIHATSYYEVVNYITFERMSCFRGSSRKKQHNWLEYAPYSATIWPVPSGADFASWTESLRSEIKVSTMGTVKRLMWMRIIQNSYQLDVKAERLKLTVHAIWTAGGPLMPFRCHPLLLMASPTSSTFTLGSLEPNATTEAGGLPRI
jgi:hypothetical protein